MFEKLWNYIKENKVFFIIIAVLIVLLIIAILIIKNIKGKNSVLENNIKAATEEIDSLQLANGEMLYERQSYVLKLNELEEYVGITKEHIKELQKKLDNKVLYISDLEGKLAIVCNAKVDTIIVRDSTNITFPWEFKDKWYYVNGCTCLKDKLLENYLSSISMNVPLEVGLTEDWSIFVKSENPYIHFTSIEGALLDKDVYLKQQKKNRWGIGISGGIYAGYDLIYKKVYAGPGLGISISYNFFTW